ncbi:diguanylate cyclase [Deinococcus ruber]|uniref:GGDEF domain-containing protein n=1 Tax=Deinococcus ruber TaxID=1848197 RepID=A0A918FI94_9DEIO|nr:diguanylate cyclase [Deinococcus ruber]GGR39539.1 hypothetical protein GCM10008957_55440 [Deinococcus ruber]
MIARHFNEMTASLQRTLTEQQTLQQTLESRVDALVQAGTTELFHLNHLGVFIQACERLSEAADVIPQVAPALFPFGGSVLLLTPSGNALEPFAHWGAAGTGSAWLPDECWASRLGTTHAAAPGLHLPRCTHDSTSQATLCLPLGAQSEMLGIVTLQFSDAPALQAAQELAQRFADRLSLSLANVRLQETLRQQSVRDPLTGLYNRRYFEEIGMQELLRARRHQQPLSVVMLDVDHFKLFNDQYGHGVGDLVLRRLAHHLGHLFQDEIVCRYGGEEFIILLPKCDAQAASERAENLRAAVQGMTILTPHSSRLSVTVSIGVTESQPHEMDLASVVRRADQALYRAKHLGRNQVVSSVTAAS